MSGTAEERKNYVMRQITARTKLAALLGNPVGHSVSPILHNRLSELLDNDLAYTAFPVEAEALGDAVKGAWAFGFLGMNVTVPHKRAVMEFLKEVDEDAMRIGAVNTVVRREDGFYGYNTDMPGLHRAVTEEGIELKAANAIVLGAGGAARACTHMLGKYGAAKVFVLNRSVEKAEELTKELAGFYPETEWKALPIAEWEALPGNGYLCFQATSVGLTPNTEASPIEDKAFYQKLRWAFDCIFNPTETKFMKYAKEAGAGTANGLKMLLYQGILAYELWTGLKVPDEAIEKVLVSLKEALGLS